MTRAWATVALAALALAGCGGDRDGTKVGLRPVPSCEALDHEPCDVLQAACQQRLFALTSCLRGDQPGSPPPISVLSEAALGEMLAAEAAMSQPRPHLDAWDWAWSSLGLIAPGALTPSAMAAVDTKWLGGYYSATTKQIVLIDHGDQGFDHRSGSLLLVHELVHALQDREVDLINVRKDIVWTRDNSLAVRALTEGEATMHQTRYLAAISGFDVDDAELMTHFQNAVANQQDTLLEDPSPLTTSSRSFPYVWGARYVHDVWRAGGMDAVHALLVTPTITTRVLMASAEHALPPEPPLPPPPAPAPTAEWTEVGTDTLGAWGVFLARAAAPADEAEGEALGLAWRTDGFWLYKSTSATAFVWRIDLADEASAVRLTTFFAGTPKLDARRAGTTVTVASSSDGSLLTWLY